MAFHLDAQHYEQLSKDLDEFLEKSEATSVLLCDRGGNIIVNSGEQIDAVDLISALVAGAFAATQELAAVIGEKEFTCIFHQGTKVSIFISAVGDEVLLLALFSDNTNAGLVKMYALNTIRNIAGMVGELMDTNNMVESEDPTASFVISKGPIFRQ